LPVGGRLRRQVVRVEPLEGRQLLAAELISVNLSGTSGNGDSGEASVSQDGRFVVFSSTSSDLVAGDNNGFEDVFLRDRSTGTTTLISKNPGSGALGDEDSFEPKITNDGNFVIFVSRASNLVAGDSTELAGGNSDVFRYNRQTGEIQLVSMTTAGNHPDGDSSEPNVSADGRFVVFSSFARNLGAADDNGGPDIFIRDMSLGTGNAAATRTVSVRLDGNANEATGDGRSFDPQVSDDGRFVSFRSAATNLVANDVNGMIDTYVRDMGTGTNILVSVSTAGVSGNAESESNSISGDGKFVAFRSAASDLVANDTNNAPDIFLRNLQTNQTTLLSVNRTGTASARGQSRFPWLSSTASAAAFSSSANDLVETDANGQEDIFIRDLVNGPIYLLSTSVANNGNGGNGASFDAYTSRDGRFVTFTSEASDLAAGDTNGRTDVFFTNAPIRSDNPDPGPGPDPTDPTPPPPNPDAPDTTAPTASLPATQGGMTPGSSEYLFNVNLADDTALNTIVIGDLEVVRNGAAQPATFVGVIGSGKSAQATYRITFTTPLSAADNGVITVNLPAGAVKDAAGNAAAAATLGTIALNVGDPNAADLTAAVTPKVKGGTLIAGTKQARGSAKVAVTNIGQTALVKQPVVVTLFLSDNPTLDATDTPLGTQTKALSLKTGKGKSLSFKFNFPANVGDGNYSLIASVDANNAILEANEGNNVAVGATPVTLAQPFTDLRATVARPSGALTSGGAGNVVVNVINDGNVQLSRPVTIRLNISTDASADPADPTITTFTKKLKLKQTGGTKATPIKFNFPAGLTAGTYFVTATIDPLGEIAETSKSNNTAASGDFAIA
jgi:hypothetical protein